MLPETWVFPENVKGWLSEVEGRYLAQIATGKRVLEIGSFCGRSTICMAQTAESVYCIDPFDGRATTDQRDTEVEFRTNLFQYRVHSKVRAERGTTQAVTPHLNEKFDLVFIDGAHDLGSVLYDAKQAMALLKPGGMLAFHDYRRPCDPGVTQAVDRLLESGGTLLCLVDTVALIGVPEGGIQLDVGERESVYLGLPSYDGRARQLGSFAAHNAPSRTRQVFVHPNNGSALGLNFNTLWCHALNKRESHRIGYFAMLHDDIEPMDGFLDVLIEELKKSGADIISAVAPIKDDRGLTSTGIDNPGNPWSPLFRVTMRQLRNYPETFGAADLGHPDKALLINTGCLVCKFTDSWVERCADPSSPWRGFTIKDQIVKLPNGEFRPQMNPEDWDFSRFAAKQGLIVRATRKVVLNHIGYQMFPNDKEWGRFEIDEDCLLMKQLAPEPVAV